METTNDFIDRRTKEVRAELARLSDQANELKRELVQLSAAKAADQFERPVSGGLQPDTRPLTIKQQILKILDANASGMKAKEIQEQLDSRFGRKVKRECLSPQLSRLAHDGKIERRSNMRWAIATLKSPMTRAREHVQGRDVPVSKENPAKVAGHSKTEGAGRSGSGLPIHASSGSNPDASIQNSS